MSATVPVRRIASPLVYRLQRYASEAAVPAARRCASPFGRSRRIYNMWVIALDSHDDIFAAPSGLTHPSLDSFRVVVTQGFWYLGRISGISSATASSSD